MNHWEQLTRAELACAIAAAILFCIGCACYIAATVTMFAE